MFHRVPPLVIAPCSLALAVAAKPPIYLWFEPEWFEGVEGRFSYWHGPDGFKPTGHWGIAGPCISAEWSTGGRSEWDSMAAAPQAANTWCHRDFGVPRAGKYKIWVRYVDHRDKAEPLNVSIQQNGK